MQRQKLNKKRKNRIKNPELDEDEWEDLIAQQP